MGVVLPSTSYQPTTAFLRHYWPCTFNEFDIKCGKSSSGRTMNGQWSNIQATSNQYKARTLTLGFSSVCSSGSAESISELPNTDDNPQVAKSSSGGSRIRQTRPIWARSLCFTTRARHRQASPPDEPVPCLLVRAQEHPHRIESSKLRKTTLVDSDRNKPCSSSKAGQGPRFMPYPQVVVPSPTKVVATFVQLDPETRALELPPCHSELPARSFWPQVQIPLPRQERSHTPHASSALLAACSSVWVSSPT
jgi:hypothetical protein